MALFVKNKSEAFTLIELLLVVSMIGIITGATISLINPAKQKQIAEDSVRRSNIEKLAQSVEAHCEGEGVCPASADWTNTNSILRTIYIKTFPTDATYTYVVNGASFEVRVPKSTDPTKYIRYNSVWGQIKDCSNTTITWSNPSCTP